MFIYVSYISSKILISLQLKLAVQFTCFFIIQYDFSSEVGFLKRLIHFGVTLYETWLVIVAIVDDEKRKKNFQNNLDKIFQVKKISLTS